MTENFLFFGQKFEIRHEVKLALTTKYETMTKNTNAPMTKTTDFQLLSFGHFLIRYSDLFRISNFDIRILPEHDFQFRH